MNNENNNNYTLFPNSSSKNKSPRSIPAKTILSRNKDTSWFGCEYNMNLYRGCTHGCIYCDSRSDCYHVENFSDIALKENALPLLQRDLSKKAMRGVVATGSMSDPYNPWEKTTLATRNALELLSAYEFGVAIATKSDLIVRDQDILKEISENAPIMAKFTITTADDALAAKLEPHAPSSTRRWNALESLAKDGIFTGVLMMPLLPGLNDTAENVTAIVQQARLRGARFIYPLFGLTMRTGQREYLYQELYHLFPEKQLQERYAKKYGTRYYCASPKAKQLREQFCIECKNSGILYEMRDIIAAYRQGYGDRQLSLFD